MAFKHKKSDRNVEPMILPHVLVCATDAGGARNLAAVVKAAGDAARFSVFGGDSTIMIFTEQGIEYAVLNEAPDTLMIREAPDFYLYGRTRLASDDRRLAGAAKRHGVPSTLVLDEWYYYRQSVLDEAGRAAFIPDHICCPDDLARDEATKEGLPEDRLVVTGSPALADLADQIESFVKTPPPVPGFLDDDYPRPLVLFLSETHAVDFGDKPGESGPMGPFLGYSENSVRKDIMSILSELDRPCTVVEKLHPGDTKIGQARPGASKVNWVQAGDVPLWPLMWHSDLVISMRSMGLLEAALMGKRAISYQPDLIGKDICTAARKGLVDKGRGRDGLAEWLQKHWDADGRGAPRSIPRPDFAAPTAARQVLAVALGERLA